MSQKDVTEGCHGRWKFAKGKKREGGYSVLDDSNTWIKIYINLTFSKSYFHRLTIVIMYSLILSAGFVTCLFT